MIKDSLYIGNQIFANKRNPAFRFQKRYDNVDDVEGMNLMSEGNLDGDSPEKRNAMFRFQRNPSFRFHKKNTDGGEAR